MSGADCSCLGCRIRAVLAPMADHAPYEEIRAAVGPCVTAAYLDTPTETFLESVTLVIAGITKKTATYYMASERAVALQRQVERIALEAAQQTLDAERRCEAWAALARALFYGHNPTEARERLATLGVHI